MEEIFQKLRDAIDKLEEEYKRKQIEEYKKTPHIQFKTGDIVTNGEIIGRVVWTENPALNISEEEGFMGVDILNGDLGFLGPCKRNDFRLVSRDTLKLLMQPHDIFIELTGEQIYELLYYIDSRDTSYRKSKNILREKLEEKIREIDVIETF